MRARKSDLPLKNEAFLRLGFTLALGGVSFFFFSAATTLLVPLLFLGYFAQLPLFVLGVTAGYGDVLIAGAFGMLLNFLFSGEAHLLSYALFYVLPPGLLAYVACLREKGKTGLEPFLGQGFMLVGFFLVSLLFLLFENPDAQGLLRASMAQAVGLLSQKEASGLSSALAESVHYLPALITLAWMMMIFANAAGAQWLAKWFQRKRLYVFTFKNWAVFQWQYWFLAAALAGALLVTGAEALFAKNVVLLALVPFLLEGLAIFHDIYPKIMKASWGIAVFYGLVFLLGWPLLALVFLGVFEPWIQVRQRLASHVVSKIKTKKGL